MTIALGKAWRWRAFRAFQVFHKSLVRFELSFKFSFKENKYLFEFFKFIRFALLCFFSSIKAAVKNGCGSLNSKQ
jgi:hypothetical protein